MIIATNGYTGDVTPQFKRRVVPVGSYIIATEELAPEIAASISPKNRSFADTRRVLTYYRMSPDGKRLIFGGRAKFGHTDPVETAPILHGFMMDRFPQLKGTKITHAWTGNVAFTLDETPHMGTLRQSALCAGLQRLRHCHDELSGPRRRPARSRARPTASTPSTRPCFRTIRIYNGSTWFLPWVGRYFRTRDWIDRRFG